MFINDLSTELKCTDIRTVAWQAHNLGSQITPNSAYVYNIPSIKYMFVDIIIIILTSISKALYIQDYYTHRCVHTL